MQHLISPILQNIPILFQIVPHVLHLLHPFCHEFIQGTTCRDGPIKQLHVENTFSIRLWKATSVDQRRNNLVLLTLLFFYFMLFFDVPKQLSKTCQTLSFGENDHFLTTDFWKTCFLNGNMWLFSLFSEMGNHFLTTWNQKKSWMGRLLASAGKKARGTDEIKN